MLSLLAALLLAGPPAARAEDAPAAVSPGPDARDADGDGSVSGKERRTARRAARRARRGSGGGAMTDEELDAAEAAESAARGGAASSKAAAAAAALKSSLPSADAGGGPPPGSSGGGSASGGSPSTQGSSSPAGTGRAADKPSDFTAGATGDPGRPKAPSDFALAANSGYAPAFAAAGLKLSPDGKTVLRLDGKPATAEDYARLQREIGAMPAALGRRPDFFSSVSPAHYADLKRGYREKKDGNQVYKDVGTTEGDRDFVHTASCDKLSGDCNKSVEKASYKKGDFVAPEDLDNMWDALQKELDGSAESGGMPSPGAARSDLAREKAMGAARALSDGGAGDEDAIKSAAREGSETDRTPVGRAAASARRLWKKAALVLPGASAAEDAGSGPPMALGALALAAIAAGALFMRRKG